MTVAAADLDAVDSQLGRPARGVLAVAHRCTCGLPDVVTTAPRLDDRSPFPTFYYLTCPRASSAIGTLEADGVMARLQALLTEDEEIRAAYRAAHESYVQARSAIEDVVEIATVSAGGMPERVKCLHALVAHSLAGGAGVNPIGDAALDLLDDWGRAGPCIGIGIG